MKLLVLLYTFSMALLFLNIAFLITYRWVKPGLISTCEKKRDCSSFSALTRSAIAFLWESVSSGLQYFITALRGPHLSAGSQSPLWRNSMDGWKEGCKGTRWLNVFDGAPVKKHIKMQHGRRLKMMAESKSTAGSPGFPFWLNSELWCNW